MMASRTSAGLFVTLVCDHPPMVVQRLTVAVSGPVCWPVSRAATIFLADDGLVGRVDGEPRFAHTWWSPAAEMSVWCGQRHGGSWCQWPQSATVIAPPIARGSAPLDKADRGLVTDFDQSPASSRAASSAAGPFFIGQQVPAVLSGMVNEAAESAAQFVDPREVMGGDRRERRLVPGRGQQGSQVIEAERDLEQGRGPCRILAPLDQPGERDLHARGALATGDTRRASVRLGKPLSTASATGAEGRVERGGTAFDDRPEQDR